jgi:GNAT superfamily N-acetyltransferase
MNRSQPALAFDVRPIAAVELETLAPALADLLEEAVNGGASLGFIAPLSHRASVDYWDGVRTELMEDSRLLFGAWLDRRLIGTAQLALPRWQNARHRGEVQKVLVASAARGIGAGGALMHALHAVARRSGRSLLILGARRADPAERFYKRLGYREAGAIPGYSLDAAGKRHDNVMLYRELDP